MVIVSAWRSAATRPPGWGGIPRRRQMRLGVA